MANTIVEYMHEHEGYRCGYCGSPDSNFSHGMWAHSLSAQDYQDLINRGWRRSGQYLYKPLMDKMCCPCYTIRCAALEFKPSKSQKKVIKKMIRFLSTGERPGHQHSSKDTVDDVEADTGSRTAEHPAQERELRQKMTAAAAAAASLNPTDATTNVTSPIPESLQSSKDETEVSRGRCLDDLKDGQNENSVTARKESCSSGKKRPKPGLGPDPSKPPCRKAKEVRQQRKLCRLSQSQSTASSSDKKQSSQPKSLEEFFEDVERASHNSKHKLEVRLVRSSPRSHLFDKTFRESYKVYHRYQVTIHKDPPSKPSERQYKLVRSSPRSEEFQEKFKASHQVFAKYQKLIHKEPDEDCQENDFKRFLVDSPLQEERMDASPECGYGSFHMHYLLDGKIIAVGVLDILPSCVSSVYLYYDPEYSFLSLGTFSALRELYFTRQLHQEAPKIDYYYMGFYIHSCPKMRYKGQYHPSYIVCPEAYTWWPIKQCCPKMELSKYSRLDESDAADEPVDLQNVRILFMQMSMMYSDYRHFKPHADDEDEVREYAQFVGKTCSRRILLFRH